MNHLKIERPVNKFLKYKWIKKFKVKKGKE